MAATVVHNEYIADRHHVQMNSTKWLTLTEFVKYLGSTGNCKAEVTPKGWFMTYVDGDFEALFEDRMKNKSDEGGNGGGGEDGEEDIEAD